MWKRIDNCVGCRTIFGNCLGTGCRNHARTVLVCDECEEQSEELYRWNNKVLCFDCLMEEADIEKIDEEEMWEE